MYRNERSYLTSLSFYTFCFFIKIIFIVSIGFSVTSQRVYAEQIKRSLIYKPIVIRKPKKTVKIIKPKIRRIEKTRVKTNKIQHPKTIKPVINTHIKRINNTNSAVTKKILTVKQRKAVNRKVVVLKNKINSERQKSQRIKLLKIHKVKLLRNTFKPIEKKRLKIEIGNIQQQLDLSQFKIKEFEKKKVTYSLQLSASSQSFADDVNHLGGRSGPHKSNAPCFIATAAYGSSLASEVSVFRQFRDDYLNSHWAGRKFVRFYYDHSPPIAAFIAKYEFSRLVTRFFLWPLLMLVKYPFLVLLTFSSFLITFFYIGSHKPAFK